MPNLTLKNEDNTCTCTCVHQDSHQEIKGANNQKINY